MFLSTQQWEWFQNTFQNISEGIALAINFLLIYLILNHSPKKLGSYKYLMIYISVSELLYAVIDYLVSPFFFSHGPALVVIVNQKKSFFGKEVSRVLLSVYSGFFGSSMAIFGIHFIYRYLVASGNTMLATFSTWKLSLWLSFPMFYASLWGLGTYYLCGSTEYTTEFVRESMLENFGLEIEDIVYFALNFYQNHENGEVVIVYEQILAILINSFIITSSISTTVYFGVKCFNKINKLVIGHSVSNRSRTLQRQLFYALVVQTMIPVILMHIPVSIIYTFAFLGKGMGTICGFASITISMYPALDPLPTIFIIKNYRNAVLSCIPCLSKANQSESRTTSKDASRPQGVVA